MYHHNKEAIKSNKLTVLCWAKDISNYHEYEGGIENSIPRMTDWNHETISDREGRIFLSHPHTHDEYFLLLTTKYLILY